MKKVHYNTVVHEILERSHRIVLHKPDQTCEAGKWAGLDEVATLGKYYAVTGESPLPQGVFTCTEQRHQVLS